MSNVTKTFNVYKDMTYTIGMRSFGKEDLVKSFKGQPEETTISRNDMQNYVLSGIEMQPVINDNKAVIDFSNVKLPWKFEYSDRLLTSRFAIAPYGTTVTQPKYVKELNATIIGSPTVTEDFVVSGFSISNYIQATPPAFSSANNWEIKLKARTTNTTSPQIIYHARAGNDNNNRCGIMVVFEEGKFHLLLSSNNSTWDIGNVLGNTYLANTDYYIKVSFNGSKYELKYSTDDINYTTTISITSSIKVYGSLHYANIGSRPDTTAPLIGSIDLKECYVKLDGVEVWSGTKWVNKRLNATKIGSPIVSEDFVASGFDTNKYFTYTLQEALGNDYEVLLKFHTPNTAQSGGQVILSLADGIVPVQERQNIYIALNNSGTILYAKTGDGNTNTLDGALLDSIQNNTDYYIKLVSTPSSTTFYASTTGFTNMTMVGTVNASLSLTNKLLRFGYDADNTAKSYLKGSIDFKECSIKKNGVEIWRGVEDLGTETLSGCVRYYFGHRPDATTPPEDSSNTYNIYAVNGDEGIVLDSKWYDYGGLTTRPVLSDGPVPTFENEWYLGEYRVETGEEGSPYSPDGGYFPGGGIVLS